MLSIKMSSDRYATTLSFAGFDYPNKCPEISSCSGRGLQQFGRQKAGERKHLNGTPPDTRSVNFLLP